MRHALVLLFLASLSASVCAKSFKTTVIPLAAENFSGPCDYDLTLPTGSHSISAVLVVFDRGRDIMKFYSDIDVARLARRQSLALMMPHQCPAKDAPGSPEEMDMDPSHGIARALFGALDQFSKQTGHSELTSAKLVLLGFSGTGALFAHFVGYAPERIVGAILADPGHFDPVGIDNVHLLPPGIEVPELIMAGGADAICGTQRPYDYFRSYRERGAPWAFLVQNKTPHCCIINAKALVLLWLYEILKLRRPSSSEPLRRIDDSAGWFGFIRTCPSHVRDEWGTPTWDICYARIQATNQASVPDEIPAGWFPTHGVALAWLTFVKRPRHSVESLP